MKHRESLWPLSEDCSVLKSHDAYLDTDIKGKILLKIITRDSYSTHGEAKSAIRDEFGIPHHCEFCPHSGKCLPKESAIRDGDDWIPALRVRNGKP